MSERCEMVDDSPRNRYLGVECGRLAVGKVARNDMLPRLVCTACLADFEAHNQRVKELKAQRMGDVETGKPYEITRW